VSFLAPIAGLIAGGVGSTLVVLFWMLKLRRRPVRVSSTLLWKKSVRDLEGNIPWQRVRPSFLLFLQLLAVVLLAMAIARPTRDAAVVVSGEVVVVIDAGASMKAIADIDGSTRLELAKRDASALVRQIGSRSSSTRFRVVRGGSQAQLVSGRAGTWRQAIASINSIEANDSVSDLDSAMELVEAMRSGESTDERSIDDSMMTYVFSDDSEAKLGDAILRVPMVGDPTQAYEDGNLGIAVLAAQRDQSDADRCRVFVTIAGRVSGKTGVIIRATAGDLVLASRAIELDPDEDGVAESTATLVFDLDREDLLEVSIQREDALESDNRGWVLLPDPSPIVTTVVAPDGIADPLLVDVLGAATGGRVEVVAEGQSVSGSTGLMVYDRVVRDPRVLMPTISFVGSESEDEALSRVLSWERGHPTMRDVDLGGLRYIGGGVLAGEALATGTSGVVISEIAENGVRHLSIGFALEDSNWGVQISMPMFVSNAVGYLLPGTSGSGRVYRTGQPLGEEGVVIDQVGLAEVDGERIGVGLLDRGQSVRAGNVLADDAEGDRSQTFTSAGTTGRVELWRWFVLAGLCVLTLEWVLDLSRRRIA
jgi:Aerotolerance regulator N-terminal